MQEKFVHNINKRLIFSSNIVIIKEKIFYRKGAVSAA